MKTGLYTVFFSTLLSFGVAKSYAQSGGPYTLNWSSRDAGGDACSGGVTPAGGAKYTLTGVAGQPDAGASTVGTYTLQGGYLPAFQKPLGPPLRMERSGGGFLLSWSSSSAGFHLEAASDVAVEIWTDLGTGFHSGSAWVVPVTGNQSYRFFRLRKACSGGCAANCHL